MISISLKKKQNSYIELDPFIKKYINRNILKFIVDNIIINKLEHSDDNIKLINMIELSNKFYYEFRNNIFDTSIISTDDLYILCVIELLLEYSPNIQINKKSNCDYLNYSFKENIKQTNNINNDNEKSLELNIIDNKSRINYKYIFILILIYFYIFLLFIFN